MNDDQFMQIMRTLKGLGGGSGSLGSIAREMRESFDNLHKTLDTRAGVLSRRKIGYCKDSKRQSAKQTGVRFARTS